MGIAFSATINRLIKLNKIHHKGSQFKNGGGGQQFSIHSRIPANGAARVIRTTDPNQPPNQHIIAHYDETLRGPEVNLHLSQGGWETEPEI